MRHIAVAALLSIVLCPAAPARASSTDRAILPASPASPVSSTDRAALLASWTQPTEASTAAWNAAWLDQPRWAEYRFDWSSDLCSRAPDTPLGFDFGNACRHHDFGYRNYRADFGRHKERIDEVFRADLRRVCDGHELMAQPFCNGIAFTYYEAVRLLVKA